MVEHEATSTSQRPIRELVCPDLEMPIETRKVREERRRHHRFTRRLPGALIVEDAAHPVTCVDIGYGGTQVVAPRRIRVNPGSRVALRIELGTRTFQDEFSVVGGECTTDRTTLHLAL